MGDQAMAIEHGVNGATGRDFDVMRQSSQQALADLACTPMRFLAFGSNNRRGDLSGQLVGIAERTAGPIAEAL
ncbi:MAG TPA: hypothetical protein VKU01_08500 [Bryobacteraceae bacterium]|nr:hypothetical protein [Bryobacteraceae bacterium]